MITIPEALLDGVTTMLGTPRKSKQSIVVQKTVYALDTILPKAKAEAKFIHIHYSQGEFANITSRPKFTFDI